MNCSATSIYICYRERLSGNLVILLLNYCYFNVSSTRVNQMCQQGQSNRWMEISECRWSSGNYERKRYDSNRHPIFCGFNTRVKRSRRALSFHQNYTPIRFVVKAVFDRRVFYFITEVLQLSFSKDMIVSVIHKGTLVLI